MTIKEEIQIEEYKRTFAEAYKQGFKDAMSVCKTKQTSEIIEAYSRGFEDGADAVKQMQTEPTMKITTSPCIVQTEPEGEER